MTINTGEHEQGLLLQISEGDEDAFKQLFREHVSILRSFVIRFTKSAFGCEEVIQNTFIRVWLNREKLESVSNVRSWLFKYASNECLNYLRSQKKYSRMEGVDDEVYSIPDLNTIQTIRINEIKKLVAQAVAQLSEQRKRIYLLSRNEGMTIPEIALALQISPNTVKNALVISLKQIREYLARHGYTLSVLAILFLKK